MDTAEEWRDHAKAFRRNCLLAIATLVVGAVLVAREAGLRRDLAHAQVLTAARALASDLPGGGREPPWAGGWYHYFGQGVRGPVSGRYLWTSLLDSDRYGAGYESLPPNCPADPSAAELSTDVDQHSEEDLASRPYSGTYIGEESDSEVIPVFRIPVGIEHSEWGPPLRFVADNVAVYETTLDLEGSLTNEDEGCVLGGARMSVVPLFGAQADRHWNRAVWEAWPKNEEGEPVWSLGSSELDLALEAIGRRHGIAWNQKLGSTVEALEDKLGRGEVQLPVVDVAVPDVAAVSILTLLAGALAVRFSYLSRKLAEGLRGRTAILPQPDELMPQHSLMARFEVGLLRAFYSVALMCPVALAALLAWNAVVSATWFSFALASAVFIGCVVFAAGAIANCLGMLRHGRRMHRVLPPRARRRPHTGRGRWRGRPLR